MCLHSRGNILNIYRNRTAIYLLVFTFVYINSLAVHSCSKFVYLCKTNSRCSMYIEVTAASAYLFVVLSVVNCVKLIVSYTPLRSCRSRCGDDGRDTGYLKKNQVVSNIV